MTSSVLSALSGSSSGPGTSSTGDRSRMGKDDFMRLLMTQLGNQDPTAPTDTKETLVQLTQFANLELQQNANDQLEALLVATAGQSQLAATGMLGKDVLLRTDKLDHKAGVPDPLGVRVADSATDVKVVIKDKDGNVVRTLELGDPGSDAKVTWDGMDANGVPAPAGTYTITATASDVSGNKVNAEVHRRGHVDGISYANGFPELLIGDLRVKMSDVVEVDEVPGATSAGPTNKEQP